MNTRIRVRCGGGYSSWMEVADTLGQGSGGAALASQANLDKGITTIFKGSTDLVYYGTEPVSPLIFQDDVFSLSKTVNAARASLQKVNSVMKQKRLTLNKGKTAYIFFGQQEKQDQIREALKLEPLICESFDVQKKQFDKYLGEISTRNYKSKDRKD